MKAIIHQTVTHTLAANSRGDMYFQLFGQGYILYQVARTKQGMWKYTVNIYQDRATAVPSLPIS
jgi:hypothetical protein